MQINMKFKKILFSLSIFLVINSAYPASLLEIYQQALQADPRIHEAEARHLASLEIAPQARSALLPQIQFRGSLDNSNNSGLRIIEQTFDQDSNSNNWGISLRQSIFRWDQIINLRRSDKLVTKAEAIREAAQQDLIMRVAKRYFDILASEDQLTSMQTNSEAISRQLEQAKKRFDVGLIAVTDVQESQAAYDQSIANVISAKRRLATARESLREITGQYVKRLNAPDEKFPLIKPTPNNEEGWVKLSLSQNPNLIASRLNEKLARDEISYRRNGYYPSVELVVSKNESSSEGDVSVGNNINIFDNTNISDQISLQFILPIFSGGYNTSRVREAIYLYRASRQELQRITRETERQTRDAYLGVISEMSRVKALKQAVASSQTALLATQAGYDVGTRTIIEVLNSQFSLSTAITNFYQSRYNYIINALQLKQSAGILQVQDLEIIDQWLTKRVSPEELEVKRRDAPN